MAYLVQFEDHLDIPELRQQHRPAHVEHIKTHLDRILSAGPLFNDDGVPCGGVILLDVDDKAEAVTFAENDPYTKLGVHKGFRVIRYNQTFAAGKFLG